MLTLILRRLLQLPLVLAVVLTLTFFLCILCPGDPVQGNKEMTEQTKRTLRAQWQFDEPIQDQFLIYLGHLSPLQIGEWNPQAAAPGRWLWYSPAEWRWKTPDLRTSIPFHMPVERMIAEALPVSLVLGVTAMTLALAIGTTAGVIGAVWRNRWPDYLSLTLSLVGVSLPSFVTGVVLLILGSVVVHAFPVGGWGTLGHLAMPALALSLPYAAYIARLTRAGMLDCLSQDYVRTARAKGLSPWNVITGHALRNACLPVVSFLGPAMANILTGSFVVENIFFIPGVGSNFVTSVTSRDYFLVIGIVLVYSTLLVLFNLVTDIAYGFLDPRIRTE
jgi:oligopeptide transport system permease protein